jgi:ribosomal protein S17
MRTVHQWTVGVALACTTLLGCEKSSEQQQREATRAAAEADKKQAQATNEADKKMREARGEVDKERGDLHETVTREKADYHAKIQKTIGDLEKDLSAHKIDVTQIHRGDRTKDRTMYGSMPAKDFDTVEATIIRRDRLLDYNDKIDATLDNDWPALKRTIDAELGAKGMLKPGRT